jgi:hypothetical protein
VEPHEHIKREPVDEPKIKQRRIPLFVRIILLSFFVWLVAAYFLLPLAWRLVPRQHPELDNMPRISRTKQGICGDPINIAIVGTGEEIVAAMLKSRWLPADPITVRSSLRIAVRTVRSRPYETAPVSDLFVRGRKQDLTFQQAIGKNPKRRHHIRFWRSDELEDDDRPLWIGAVTLDVSVGLSRTTGQITHRIDADVDTERNKLLADLDKSRAFVRIDWIDKFHTQLKGRNGGGDRWYTDGRLPVVILKPRISAH